ncbi:hypothetical protein AA15669_0148 [Saccharibacter floricola DSM 15669]|uniref:Uncharacterized protein n=1 Tax=Saccharibacter floricola DSM 15669 TaxID=1123227 RepID=A0ABQ0NWI4_9PROT|nr:hypothetical protein AA15669_0148 [Saccharibacter floricola DSM 15669]
MPAAFPKDMVSPLTFRVNFTPVAMSFGFMLQVSEKHAQAFLSLTHSSLKKAIYLFFLQQRRPPVRVSVHITQPLARASSINLFPMIPLYG